MKHFLKPCNHAQATPNTHGHGTGLQTGYLFIGVLKKSGKNLSIVVSVLANAVGGTLVISAMFLLPQIIAGLIN